MSKIGNNSFNQQNQYGSSNQSNSQKKNKYNYGNLAANAMLLGSFPGLAIDSYLGGSKHTPEKHFKIVEKLIEKNPGGEVQQGLEKTKIELSKVVDKNKKYTFWQRFSNMPRLEGEKALDPLAKLKTDGLDKKVAKQIKKLAKISDANSSGVAKFFRGMKYTGLCTGLSLAGILGLVKLSEMQAKALDKKA